MLGSLAEADDAVQETWLRLSRSYTGDVENLGEWLTTVLDRLTPAERIAFVLHDLFAVSFADIGPIVGRSPSAAKKLASRARNRVRGAAAPEDDVARRWRVAEALSSCGARR
jgi:RNA polymerase sigma-70 factor (ECF subfamily)